MGNYFSNAEHNKIRCSAEVQTELARIAKEFADQADFAADEIGGYGTDMVVGTDRARAHVWPQTKAARRAEARDAHLMMLEANGLAP